MVKVRKWLRTSAAAMAVALALVACDPVEEGASGATSVPESSLLGASSSAAVPGFDPEAEAPAGEAAEVLETLAVKGRAPKTGYSRDEFGPRWADVDHNGCDTRNDILDRDLAQVAYQPGTQDCVVVSGVLQDPFTGSEIQFTRGQDTSSAVQIDHVVALSDAWQKGAQQLDGETRRLFANDPLNLLAVEGRSNSQKGDGDAATWLPANRSFRCDYVSRQIAVKARYGLWVTEAEQAAMQEVLSTCPGHPLPVDDSLLRYTEVPAEDPIVEPEPEPAPVPAAEPAPEPVIPAEAVPALPAVSDVDPRFSTCKEAIAAGYGPYAAGIDAEYDWYRDGDGDGVNCER